MDHIQTEWIIQSQLEESIWKQKNISQSVDDLWIHGQLTPNMRDVHINVYKPVLFYKKTYHINYQGLYEEVSKVWVVENLTKRSSVLLLCLVRFSTSQTLCKCNMKHSLA